MAKLLYIEVSPRESSLSTEVAQFFLEKYRHAHLTDQIEILDLWKIELPPFDDGTIEAKFAVLRKNKFTPQQQKKWEAVRSLSQRFNEADKYVFSVPMWNFGIPYPLKHYIDVITLAEENWTWSRTEGYRSLLSGKKALMIYTSAGSYFSGPPYNASDFQKPYMRCWLNFIGVTDIQEITLAPTLTDADAVTKSKQEAKIVAAKIATAF